jgi:superfamily II helicase
MKKTNNKKKKDGKIFVVYKKNPNIVPAEQQQPEMFSTFELAQKYRKEHKKGFIVEESATADIIETLQKEERGEVGHEYVCQNCGKIATKNLQQTWHEYDILDDGDFEENESWEGDENSFFCDACYKKEMK